MMGYCLDFNYYSSVSGLFQPIVWDFCLIYFIVFYIIFVGAIFLANITLLLNSKQMNAMYRRGQ